jgi:hypothetical protein
MSNLAVPIGVTVLTGFGIVYGWILHRAVEQSVYKVTGIRALDTYLLSWVFGLLTAFVAPMTLYVAFGFNEFADTPEGVKLLQRLHWAARFEVLGLCLYGIAVLMIVPQVPMK